MLLRGLRGFSLKPIFSTSNPFSSSREKSHDVFIIGAGCIGQSLTISLIQSNLANRVFLQTKTQYIDRIQKSGLTSKGAVEGTFFPNEKFHVIDKIDDRLFKDRQIKNSPIVFSATKANDAVSSLIPFHNISDIHPNIICLQNGLGSEREIQRSLPRRNHGTVLKGHVLGAVHQKETHLFAYKGKILVEKDNELLSQNLQEIFRHQHKGIFSLEISPNIYRDIYPKIAVNCVCNPLTIILNKNLGFIKTHYAPLIGLICDEIYKVANSQGIELMSNQDLFDFVLDMMSNFSSHYSSMYLDHVAGRETEINYINGGILKIAQEKGIDVPINLLLTNAVKEIQEKRKLAKSAEDFYQTHACYLQELTQQLTRRC